MPTKRNNSTILHPDAVALVTPEEAARLLSVSTKTLANQRVAGTGLRFVKLGGKSVRYRLADLLAYIESHTVTSTSAEIPDGPGM